MGFLDKSASSHRCVSFLAAQGQQGQGGGVGLQWEKESVCSRLEADRVLAASYGLRIRQEIPACWHLQKICS